MSIYKVSIERDYKLRERVDTEVSADSPEQAVALAKAHEYAAGYETEWSEVDGGSDPATYAWTVTAPDGSVTTATGTDDDKDTGEEEPAA